MRRRETLNITWCAHAESVYRYIWRRVCWHTRDSLFFQIVANGKRDTIACLCYHTVYWINKGRCFFFFMCFLFNFFKSWFCPSFMLYKQFACRSHVLEYIKIFFSFYISVLLHSWRFMTRLMYFLNKFFFIALKNIVTFW